MLVYFCKKKSEINIVFLSMIIPFLFNTILDKYFDNTNVLIQKGNTNRTHDIVLLNRTQLIEHRIELKIDNNNRYS